MKHTQPLAFTASLMLACLGSQAAFAADSSAGTSYASAGSGSNYQSVPANTCNASASWFTSPSLPKEVTEEKNCDFHQFMWQSFLYLVQPANEQNTALNFDTWMPATGIFVKDGEVPKPWGTTPAIPMCKNGKITNETKSHSPGYQFANLTLQAGSHQPLIDREMNPVFYTVSVNQPAYDFLTQCDLYKAQCGMSLAPDIVNNTSLAILNIPKQYPELAFPIDSVELKLSWKVLTSAQASSGLFYTTLGTTLSHDGSCSEAVTLGLVGMHIVSKTPNHPEFIWATFEHKNNAPYCTDLDAAPPLGGDWNFYNQSCKEGECANLNEYNPNKPAQVCRAHPWGDPTLGEFVNGLDCSSNPPPHFICQKNVQDNVIDPNTANLKAINASMTALLSALPASDPNRLWANYELVGNIWTLGGSLPPYLQSQRGSLSAANTTMETFVQNGVSGITPTASCFGCHNLEGHTLAKPGEPSLQPLRLPPAGLSHIFNLINNQSQGCEQGTSLPNACAVYQK